MLQRAKECGLEQLIHDVFCYDVTGKICPKYFVEHEDAWEQFKADVQQQIGVLAS